MNEPGELEVKEKCVSALAVARPVWEELSSRSFSGQVVGLFERACNIIGTGERVIALTQPEIGHGPFSIVIGDCPNLFNSFSVHQPVRGNQHELEIGSWHIVLRAAAIWEPKIGGFDQPLYLDPALLKLIQPYLDWPPSTDTTPVTGEIARLMSEAAAQLTQAISLDTGIEDAAVRLAGLGGGLTPAGDDYLVGVMAALWLSGQPDKLPKIAAVAIPKTTTLSAAFLKAAAQGEYIEPWHSLASALLNENASALTKSLKHLAEFGASSGLAALAGFTGTFLSLIKTSNNF